MISDIDKDVFASKIISFVDDTKLYSDVGDVTDYDNLQFDQYDVCDWASVFPYTAIVRLIFTFLICINDAQTLLAGFSEHFL